MLTNCPAGGALAAASTIADDDNAGWCLRFIYRRCKRGRAAGRIDRQDRPWQDRDQYSDSASRSLCQEEERVLCPSRSSSKLMLDAFSTNSAEHFCKIVKFAADERNEQYLIILRQSQGYL